MPHAAPRSRFLIRADGFSVSEYLCSAGPADRPFEERHDGFSISAVVEGTFTYRSDNGSALLHPGALLLGNHGTCFECGHDHGTGDRCIAVHYAPELFEEIAASAAPGARRRFATGMMPAVRALTPLAAALEGIARGRGPSGADALALELAERVLSMLAGASPSTVAPSPDEHRRIAAVIRYMEQHSHEALDLDALARVAIMSKYHFARCFRRITGAAPYDYLLGLRLRRAARRLRETEAPIASIAYDSGFGDISTFHERWRRVFGSTPRAWRERHA